MLTDSYQHLVDSANLYEECLGRNTMELASCLSNLAVVKFQAEHLKDAVSLQDKAHIIISEIAGRQSEAKERYIFSKYMQSSKELLDYYTAQCVLLEKSLKMVKQSSRPFARNTVQK